MTIGDKIKALRKQAGMTQTELGIRLGVKKNAVSKWECGRVEDIPASKIKAMALLFDVPTSYLIDEDTTQSHSPSLPGNIMPVPKMKKVPLIGTIACGTPILAVEDATEYVSAPEGYGIDFALTCKGDSMINARIFDGDIVYIRQQPMVDNGQIAAVIIGEEATLKKVYYTPNSDRIVLQACNPMYNDMVYSGSELDQITFLGKAVYFFSSVRT